MARCQFSVPVTAGNLGTRENTVAGGTISGHLGEVQVSDARAAAAGSGARIEASRVASARDDAHRRPGPDTRGQPVDARRGEAHASV